MPGLVEKTRREGVPGSSPLRKKRKGICPDFSQAKAACEKSAFSATDCGKSFGAVLMPIVGLTSLGALSIVETAQGSSSTRPGIPGLPDRIMAILPRQSITRIVVSGRR